MNPSDKKEVHNTDIRTMNASVEFPIEIEAQQKNYILKVLDHMV